MILLFLMDDLDASSRTVTITFDLPLKFYIFRLIFLFMEDCEESYEVSMQARFPRQSEQVERLECNEPVTHSYLLTLIRHMSTAFAIANKLQIYLFKVSILCDSRGVLSVQFMVEQTEHKQVYIEFHVSEMTMFVVLLLFLLMKMLFSALHSVKTHDDFMSS
ncbi:unnamed protein product [Strongylus vulgaris]|uniref:Checkpoint protein n=1 Tax=Strongylus vulgaris TaxID=40348 RepID=A0A3P7IL04_STRVU|nr:unnamed protein product [Strongylus vulgaris]